MRSQHCFVLHYFHHTKFLMVQKSNSYEFLQKIIPKTNVHQAEGSLRSVIFDPADIFLFQFKEEE